jgi:hypothetical protein
LVVQGTDASIDDLNGHGRERRRLLRDGAVRALDEHLFDRREAASMRDDEDVDGTTQRRIGEAKLGSFGGASVEARGHHGDACARGALDDWSTVHLDLILGLRPIALVSERLGGRTLRGLPLERKRGATDAERDPAEARRVHRRRRHAAHARAAS